MVDLKKCLFYSYLKPSSAFLEVTVSPAAPVVVPDDPLRAYSVAATNLGVSTSPANAPICLAGLCHTYVDTELLVLVLISVYVYIMLIE